MNLAIWDIESSSASTDFGSIIEVLVSFKGVDGIEHLTKYELVVLVINARRYIIHQVARLTARCVRTCWPRCVFPVAKSIKRIANRLCRLTDWKVICCEYKSLCDSVREGLIAYRKDNVGEGRACWDFYGRRTNWPSHSTASIIRIQNVL